MAGIGFRIRKLVDKDDYGSAIQGYLLGAFVSSGPFLTITLTIGILTTVISQEVTSEALGIFRVTLVYIYALSLLSVGLVQMNITRYVADLIYLEAHDKILPTLISSFIILTGINAVIGIAVFGLCVDIGLNYAIRSTILLIMIGNIWLLMIFITATRQYAVIAVSFVLGGGGAIICGQFLAKTAGLLGYIEGYSVGQGIILAVLMSVMAGSFPCKRLFNWNVLTSYRQFPDLFFLGVVINLGIWADKAVIWTSHYSSTTADFFRYYDPYDSSVFVAYLTAIPAMTYFLVRVETDVFIHYRQLFGLITNHHNLEEIEAAHKAFGEVLYDGFVSLVKIQLTVTGACLLLATPIMKMFSMGPMQWGIFRISLVGSLLLVCMHLIITVMLYIEQRKEALLVAVTYLLCNYGFSYVTVTLGYSYLGYGFTLAALVAFIMGFFFVKRGIDQLLYRTFACQKIPSTSTDDDDGAEEAN